MLPPFRNEPLTDFSRPENQAAFQAALDQVKQEIGRTYPLVIGGQRLELQETFPSLNPSQPSQAVAHFANGAASHADQAIEAAAQAFETWKSTPVAVRARFLLDVAAEMRRRKHEFSAVMVLEVGKNRAEADADTAEAIDFLEYYARQMMRLADSSSQLVPFDAEHLGLYYIPLGVGAVIPPWNFPNAITTGMTAAAIVAGNTVVLKPAEQSPWVAYKMCELFWNAGLPAGVLNFVTGPGEVVGGRMVEHPKTRFIAFTGSRAVGTEIYEKASRVQPGQLWLKRSILEMGGKDAIIVDETADLEAAAEGIVTSAFGFQGQKCSACSRAIIVNDVYETVAERVIARTRRLTVGNPVENPAVDLGPVIDQEAFDRIRQYIEIGHGEGELLIGGGSSNPEDGYFVEPTIFGEVAPDARLAQEEIFGPVLALIRARDFDHALEIANGTVYGLTGGVYSNDRLRLERAREEFHVGNLYFNRKITGAQVGVHPFGGFNMSGTDSKAGGPDYLLLFTQAKSVAERL
ncbi:MAG: L-glutamate gamma-semialdehyde dehydrogenase [Chloroflexota bacterium]|nr:MAG: L-glutamate gamma-semialdehyde dehydrogenase [Chloroflexota bacterium]